MWSPDGRSLAFTATANAKDLESKAKKKDTSTPKGGEGQGAKQGDAAKKDEDERESDVRVVTQSVYRFNGAGYLDAARPGHVWLLDVAGRGPDRGAEAAHERRVRRRRPGLGSRRDAACSSPRTA